MQKHIQSLCVDLEQSFLLGDHALVDEVASDTDSSGSGTLTVSGLEHIEFALFDGELHILHISVMVFESFANFEELVVNFGQYFCHLGDGHRSTNACNDVFALSVHKEFAHKSGFAGSRVTGERNAGTAIVAHVAECHHLNVYSGTPAVRNVVVHSVNVCTGVVPASEYGFDSFKELFLRIGGEVLADLFLVFGFELGCQFFKIFGGEFDVVGYALLFLHLVDESFKIFLADFHNDVGEHLNKSSVAVPSPSGVTGLLCKHFYDLLVQSEVEDGVHHTRHGCSCARTNGNEKRIFEVAELLAGDLLHLFDVFHDLRLNLGIDLLSVLIVLSASFGGNSEALGNGKTDIGHFRKVCAFAAQKFTHFCVTFGKQINILVCHLFNLLKLNFFTY